MKKSVFLAYLIIVTLVVTAVSFSKYSTSGQSSDDARVAYPVLAYVPISVMLNGSPIDDFHNGIDISNALPGDVLVYNFDICNYDGDKLNEVLLKYRISVVFNPPDIELPLEYTLAPAGPYEAAGDGWTFIDAGTHITHSYTLTVTWPADYNDSAYTGRQQSINIKIESEQGSRA